MAEYLVTTGNQWNWASSTSATTSMDVTLPQTSTFRIGNPLLPEGPLPALTPADMADDLDWLDERVDEMVDFSRLAA